MINETIQIDGTQSLRTLKELRKELKDTRDSMLNMKEGTEEYNAALRKAGDIQHELREQLLELNANADDFGQKLGNCTKTINGVFGAITATTGALSLFGVENEELQKKITATMTSMLGIVQGLDKVDNGVKAFKRLTLAVNGGSTAMKLFRGALISTGLGALVVIIGSIIANWEDFANIIGLSSERLQKLGDIAAGVFNVIKQSLSGIAKSIAKMITGDFSGAWNELKNGFDISQAYADGVAQHIQEREEENTKKLEEEAKKRQEIADKEYKERVTRLQKLYKYQLDMDEAQSKNKDYKFTDKGKEAYISYFDKLLSMYRKDSDEYRQATLDKIRFLNEYDEHFNKIAEEEAKKNDAAAKKAAEEAQKIIDNNKKIIDSFYEDNMNEDEKLNAKYQKLQDAAMGNAQTLLDIETWYQSEVAKLKEKETKKAEEEAEKQKQIELAKRQTYADVGMAIGGIIGGISDCMEEGTKEQKAMAITATTIQMLVGIATALSGAFTTKSGPWDIALAAAQAAVIATSGIASIKKIASVKKGSGDSSGSAASTAEVPTINLGSVATSTEGLNYTLSGASTEAAIADTRVYVTEHDITSTQKKVSVTENEAKY